MWARAIAVAIASAIPGVASIAAAQQSLRDDRLAAEVREILEDWLESLEHRVVLLRRDTNWLIGRIEELGDEAIVSAQRPEFLTLVRKAFMAWDRADSDSKRHYLVQLLVNHAGAPLTDDDVVRLFVDWIDRFDESHFRILRSVYRHRPANKLIAGRELFGAQLPVDASAKAGLFRELWRELNMGSLVRDARAIEGGRFRRKETSRTPRGARSPYLDPTFDEDEVELTELGSEFVQYVLGDQIRRLGPA
jgi:hypothetical protein